MTRSLHYGFVVFVVLVGGACTSNAQGRDATAGSRIFSTNCAGCHGSDGRGGERAPNIATARNVAALGDGELVNFVGNGIPGAGMPAFSFLGDRGISDVIAYLRVLQGKTDAVKVTGDAMAGRTLFFGKAECSRCHMMDGEGGFIASDLSDYGSGTALEHIWSAIVEPEKVVSPKSEVVGVRTVEGESVRGVLRAEDNFTLVIQLENGRYRRFKKDRLTNVHHTGQSLMPTDYKSRLSPKELDDLVSYLVRSAISMAPDAARKKTKESQ
ncbi:MAG TPA: c-type cytochrome [Edaphobacter sp.]|nr:c-type cytochrome [Edaphobacter sp.]